MLKNAVALTIAGSDSGGGAGIQADLKTFSACGVYGASVITAVTAQNLHGVVAIQAVKTALVEKQLRAVLEGFPVKAIKTGMMFNREIIGVVADVLGSYPRIPLVVDPVFAATSGSRLIKPQAIRTLCERLFPLAALVTPNVPEAEFLCSGPIGSLADLREAGAMLCDYYGVPFLMKGGHLNGAAVDMLFDGKVINTYRADFIAKVNSHGSGCTLAAAVAASFAGGSSLPTAVSFAKAFITDSLLQAHELRPGTKVINHFFRER